MVNKPYVNLMAERDRLLLLENQLQLHGGMRAGFGSQRAWVWRSALPQVALCHRSPLASVLLLAEWVNTSDLTVRLWEIKKVLGKN